VKFYLGIAAALAILVIVIFLLQEYSDSSGSKPATTPVVATATPGPTPDDAYPFSHTPVPVAGAPTPVPAAAAAYPPPRPAAAPVAAPGASDMRALIQSIARQAGVQIVGYQDTGGWITVTVQGRERNNLNDFLDAALRAGMKDMDENFQAYKVITDRQLRQTHQNTYKMKF